MAGRGARECTALHSLQRAGGTLGEEGAHAGVQPLPAPQLGAPATPVRAGGMEFTEDNGPPTPPSGQIRDSLSSFRPPLPPLSLAGCVLRGSGRLLPGWVCVGGRSHSTEHPETLREGRLTLGVRAAGLMWTGWWGREGTIRWPEGERDLSYWRGKQGQGMV